MRILVIGRGSFIARAIKEIGQVEGLPILAIPHDAAIEGTITPDDCVINCTIAPGYRSGPYQEALDCDLKAARAAASAKAHFVMLSTRRVYPADRRWNARESRNEDGDESFYGHNKAITEKKVLEVCNGCAGIFRLSNVFGYEYDAAVARMSFLGILLRSLKQKNTIYFDMSPTTLRDFLPVELCARMLLDRALDRTEGIYNLGSGFGLACGRLAGWIREGFGSGDLVCEPDIVKDEFFLNMEKWVADFELPVNENIVQKYCLELGRRLQCEKS